MPPLDYPVSNSLGQFFFINGWWKRVQLTVDIATLEQVVLCDRRYCAKQSSKWCSLRISTLVPTSRFCLEFLSWLPPMMDWDWDMSTKCSPSPVAFWSWHYHSNRKQTRTEQDSSNFITPLRTMEVLTELKSFWTSLKSLNITGRVPKIV